MKFGIRTPSFKKRIAARTSWKRYVRHNLGFKAPRGWGWFTNPKRAAYNRVYNRTTISVDRLFKGGRRRSRHDGSALLLVVGVVVVAAFGTYLLAAAAFVFIAWLVRIATKKMPAATAEPGPTVTPPPPEAEYQPIAQVDANVFDDVGLARVAAGLVFDAWLEHLPNAPKHGADLVREFDIQRRLIGRLTTEIDGRRFTWRSVPATGRQAVVAPPVDPSALDPWNPPHDLKSASRYIAKCWTCNAEGRVACLACGGAGRVTCTACAGEGKYYGTASNGSQRLLNCKTCKGKADVVCQSCTRGAVDCTTCDKAKKLDCWLDVDQSSRHDVQVEPEGDATKAFPWGHAQTEATSDEIATDARIVETIERTGRISREGLPASVSSEWTDNHWAAIQPQLQPGERVRSQSFTLLEVPSAVVTYSVHGETQTVAFEGLRMLAPPPWSDVLFAHRATMLRRLKYVLAALPIAALAIYLSLGAYFVTGRAAPLVAGVVSAAAAIGICAYAVVWYATLGRRTAVRWAVAAIAPMALATAFAILATPSAARASKYITGGELALAKQELDALGSASDHDLAPLWADLYLKESLAAMSCPVAIQSAAKIPDGMRQRAQATVHADELAVTAAESSLKAGELTRAPNQLACASQETQDGPRGRAIRSQVALVAAQGCVATKDWACAFARSDDARRLGATADADAIAAEGILAIQSEVDTGVKAARSEKDLGQRVQLETTALELWTSYLAARTAKEPASISALKSAETRDAQALSRQVEAERQRQEAAEKQRAAAEQRERKRQEAAAAEEERRNRPVELYCNDGTISGCGCNRSSFQGCCSHHQGIDGCHQ